MTGARGDRARRRVMVIDGSARALLLARGAVLRALRAAGHEVMAVAASDRNMAELQIAHLERRYRTMEVELVALTMDRQGTNPFADLRAFLQMVGEMRRFRPDVVLAYSAKSVLYGSLAARVTGVSAMHAMMTGLGFLFEDGGGIGRRTIRRAGRAGLAAALRWNRRVIFQNPDDRDLFLARGIVRNASQTAIVDGSGVDLTEFAWAPLPEGPPRFLMIGRLQRAKGVVEYVQAARLLRERFPEARCQLLGPFDDHPEALSRDEFATLMADRTVEYLGATADVRPFIEAATVFVLPSYREGLPRSALEAMAMGRALLLTDVPGCRQLVRQGENGFLVPPRDPDSLAAAMSRFVEMPGLADDMGAASRRLAESRFGASVVAATVVEILGL